MLDSKDKVSSCKHKSTKVVTMPFASWDVVGTAWCDAKDGVCVGYKNCQDYQPCQLVDKQAEPHTITLTGSTASIVRTVKDGEQFHITAEDFERTNAEPSSLDEIMPLVNCGDCRPATEVQREAWCKGCRRLDQNEADKQAISDYILTKDEARAVSDWVIAKHGGLVTMSESPLWTGVCKLKWLGELNGS